MTEELQSSTTKLKKWNPKLDVGYHAEELTNQVIYFLFQLELHLSHCFLDFEVTNLTPGKEYKFRVAAVNAEGESKPLETDHSIIAKNPFGKEFEFKIKEKQKFISFLSLYR